MKVLCVADVSIQNVVGGAERVLYEQCRRLHQRGHEVFILTRRLPDHAADHAAIDGITEWRYEIDSRNPFSYLFSTVRNGRTIFERLEKEIGFDCLHFHQPFSSFAVLRSPLAGKMAKIYTCHSLSFEEYLTRNPIPPRISAKLIHSINVFLRRWIERKSLNDVDQLVVLSRYTREKLRTAYGIYADRIRIIPGGVDLERFMPALDKKEVRKKYHPNLNGILLLTVRNLVPRMGLENLLEAMRKVVDQFPEVHLIIGGKGPLMQALVEKSAQQGIVRHITYTGFIPEEELPDYYRMADLFILPTRDLEGFGLVTLEALASGTPVLGTPIGGTLEILQPLNSEFLFQGVDPESLSSRIITWCDRIRQGGDDFRSDQSRKCRTFVEENFSWERNVISLEELILEINSKKACQV